MAGNSGARAETPAMVDEGLTFLALSTKRASRAPRVSVRKQGNAKSRRPNSTQQ